MSLEQVILVILSGLGVFHGIFIAVILWNIKTLPNLANRLLSILMLLLSFRIGKSVALAFSPSLPIIYVYFGLCLLLLIGPLYYLYSKTLCNKAPALTKKALLHFIPAIFFAILAVPFQFIGFKKIPDAVTALLFFIFYTHLIAYLLYTRIKLFRQNAARLPGREVREWLNLLFYGLISIWMVYVLNLFEDRIPYIIGPIVYSLTVYIITYIAIAKKYVQTTSTVKYSTIKVSEQEIETLFEKIEACVKGNNLFLEPEITLGVLASRLKTSSQKVSLAVNSKAGTNFNEYINRLRVAHATDLLMKPESQLLTIAAIGMEAGFNSLSSFNQAFKKITGKTPSAFRSLTEDKK